MTDELVKRMTNCEDNFTERKPESIKDRDIRRTLVAFANSVPEGRTAILFIGVADDGKPIGVKDPEQMQKRVRAACDDCYPLINCTLEVINKDGSFIVAAVISESKHRPHFAGPAYVRKGAESVKASEKFFDELIISRLDKCRTILKMREKSGIIITAYGKKIGSQKQLNDRMYVETNVYRIADCTNHYVTLIDLNHNNQELVEPIENVSITFDPTTKTEALIVRQN